MQKILILWLFLLNSFLYATGPSYIDISLIPIATHPHWEVLFRTYRNANHIGGSLEKKEHGWLVVSAKGVWDERVALVVDNLVGNPNEKLEKKDAEYSKGKVNLSQPDEILKSLMKKYGFERDTLLIYEKHKILELKPKQSCYLGNCIEDVLTQKSIEGYASDNISNTIRGDDFVYKGVVLMHNVTHFSDDVKQYGGQFDFGYHIAYDSEEVDAVVLINKDSRIEKVNVNIQIKREVEVVVNDIFSLLVHEKWEKFNKKYIHPKYGYYDLYAHAASAFPYHLKEIRDLSHGRRSATEALYLSNFSTVPKTFQWKNVYISATECQWHSSGIFIHDVPYSSIVKIMKYSKNDFEFTEEETVKMKFLDKDVFVVVDTEHDIIFHIKKIDGRWYVVVVDRTYTNRDA